jgi:predicted O-methyltransferase YrrM
MPQQPYALPQGLEFFRQKQWRRCISALGENTGTSHPDRQSLSCLGISHLRLGEYDCALSCFENIQPPVPASAALNWAALLAHKRRYKEALYVLSLADRDMRTKPFESALEIVACIILEDALLLIGGERDISSLKSIKRGRLLKLASLGLEPFIGMLGACGRICEKLKFPDGVIVKKLAEDVRQLSWVYGLPMTPGYIEPRIALEHLDGYERSKDVYRSVFLEYLDYWIHSRQDIQDLLLASQKPLDAHTLYCIVCQKQPAVVLEIGTFVGFSTAIMAYAIKHNGRGMIHCIDPNMKHLSVDTPILHAKRMFETLKLDAYVQIHQGFFSDPREPAELGIPVLGRDLDEILPPVDLAFIDGDHATTAVLQDFMLLLPCLSDNATVVFHDIKTWPTVRQGLLTIFRDDLWKRQMRYFEFTPSGTDGLAMIEVRKKPWANRRVKQCLDSV